MRSRRAWRCVGVVGLAWVVGLASAAGSGCAAAEVYPNYDAGDGDGPPVATDGGADVAIHDAGPDAAAADAAPDGRPPDGGGGDGGGGDAACTGTGTTPDNCGPCGVVCPGHGQATAVVGCTSPTCTFACKGESYDCNGNPADGCEVADSFQGAHSQATAHNLGTFSCNDGSSAQNISGLLPTDARTHQDPAVAGFDATIGGAPDWYLINAEGGPLCQDDISLTLQISGSATPACYRLRAITDVATYTCQTSAGGSCGFSPGMSSYTDGSIIYVVVDKTCATVTAESVSYTVTGHL